MKAKSPKGASALQLAATGVAVAWRAPGVGTKTKRERRRRDRLAPAAGDFIRFRHTQTRKIY